MILKSVLLENNICLLKSQTKDGAIRELVSLLYKTGKIKDETAILEAVFYRETLMSTGIGFGIGIPHVRLEGIGDPVVAIGVLSSGIEDYVSMDNLPVKIVILIAVEKVKHKDHVKLLALFMQHLKNEETRSKIIEATDSRTIYQTLINSHD